MTIWLTGCTAGLGRALVAEFLQAGHTLVGCGRNEIALAHLKNDFPDGHFFAADVANDFSVSEFCEAALAVAGAPDLLINNAATINTPGNLWEIPADEFDLLMAINVNGVANVIRHALPSMLIAETGMIVNFSSGWGRSPAPERAPYCASKWAIEGLTKSLAGELPEGMAAVALSPGAVATDMLRKSMGDEADNYPKPADWATTAAPFMTALTAANNGESLTTP